jgi:DNA-binding PucR family transcriptional regulator
VVPLQQDALGPLATLREHDDQHGSDYQRTLAAWLDHPGAPTQAARAIHVHPNTMRYRMSRIADLAGLDLDDATVRLAVRLQLAATLGQPRRLT